MGVVAAEAEGRDAGDPRPVGGPGLALGQEAEGEPVERGVGRLRVQRRRPHAVAHRLQHLDQAGDARRRDHVPEIRLEGADRHLGAALEDRRRALKLGRVAENRPRGVALEQRHRRGRHLSAGVGRPEGPLLPLLRRRQEPPAATVVGEADAADHPVDPVAVAARVGQTLEGDHPGALRRQETVGLGVERPALAALAEGLEGGEADVEEEIVGPVDGAGQDHVGGAVLELVAGDLERVEGAGAGAVEAKGPRTEAERRLQERDRAARHEAVTGIGLVLPLALAEPHRFGVAVHRRGREAEVSEDRPDPRAVDRPAPAVARVLEGRPGAVERPMEERIEAGERLRRQGEAGRVPDLLEAHDVAPPIAPGPVGRILVRTAEGVARGRPPAPRGRRGDKIAAFGDRLPQRLRAQSPGEDTGATDDGDGGEGHGCGPIRPGSRACRGG